MSTIHPLSPPETTIPIPSTLIREGGLPIYIAFDKQSLEDVIVRLEATNDDPSLRNPLASEILKTLLHTLTKAQSDYNQESPQS